MYISDGLTSLTQARFDFVHYRSLQSEHILVLALPLRITNADAIPPKLWQQGRGQGLGVRLPCFAKKKRGMCHGLQSSVACSPRNGITHQRDAEVKTTTPPDQQNAQPSLLLQFTPMFEHFVTRHLKNLRKPSLRYGHVNRAVRKP